MTKNTSDLTLGWSVTEWLNFHLENTVETSRDVLINLIRSQECSPQNPAWISIASIDNFDRQWQILQTRGNKTSLPLYGVPIAVKDNIDALGFETTAACPSFAYSTKTDSKVVQLLREAGAIIIGKTNLDQFATGLVGTRSPYGKTTCAFNDNYVSGGSSAGSARVVADGIVPLALGTDTAGSGRVPAALNNLIGLKPTRGALSCQGVVPACKSLDCVSIFALNLTDAERAFKIVCQEDELNDEYSRKYPTNPLQKFQTDATIAIPKDIPWFGETKNPHLYANAIESLKKTGANVITVDFEPLLELARCLYEGPWVAERYAATKGFFDSNPPEDSLDKTVTTIIRSATKFDASDAFKFEYKRQGILQKVKNLLKDIDVLCVPTCPLNPALEEVAKEKVLVNSRQGTWTNFVNLADMAALAIPSGFRDDNLPNGITLIGKRFTDYALLDLAKRFFHTHFQQGRSYGVFTNRKAAELDDNLTGPAINFESSIKLAVVGAHLKGLPLHWQLEQVNATYIGSPKTSKNYKLYALGNSGPILKPGLRRVEDGSKIQLELYSVPSARFGEFIAMVPQPLGIGSVELENGEWVKSFICEELGYMAEGSIDITSYGGFQAYVDALAAEKEKDKCSFESVLIANRGEIAVRIIKTLKKMGIKSIAIYSDPDKYSQHVLLADVAIPLHGSTAAETYLDAEKIIQIAKQTKTDAIIPGYGFLSENAAFADRCKEEGIIFIGPDGNTIRSLGLKHSAREIAEKVGVPLVPGSPLITDAQEAKATAKKIEYPVMVKSTAGGGGIGLKRVDCEKEIEEVFEIVKHQAQSYFGDAGVFIERFVENARHVEVQIMGDGKGGAVALGERDCSLQRRNQKVIEETPAPNLSNKTRLAMQKAAKDLATHLHYRCAGTVEFIYDEKRDEFYFLEVNTRLQVEHPVTEMVTGLDLVEWMILIAAGNSPNLENYEVNIDGVSMEARLYAENPVKDFKPSPGQLTKVEFPSWARVDTWVTKGTVISPEYDPTIAKIIVHGKNRAEAIQLLNQALEETKVYGCVTNADYLKSLASTAMFRNVQISTNVLNNYEYTASAIEVINPGAHTSIQDYPGRVGYWKVGVPPSGPMDSYSFRLANRIVGNCPNAPGIEMTLVGSTMKFHYDTIIAIAGGQADCTVNGLPVKYFEPISINRGDTLSIGKLSSGCRCYLAIRGELDIPEYLGSKSTFTLGELGGYNGRILKPGDVIFIKETKSKLSPAIPDISLIPTITTGKEWIIGVTCGPHGCPDIFKKESIEEFFQDQWKVHYNSNRFGVRLVGPRPKWARTDGGEGGLHPSNTHDYVYSVGAINFTGDEPVIVTCDGPSLGGFVCQAVIPEGELWKVGQVKPGDSIQFVPINYSSCRVLKESQDTAIETFAPNSYRALDAALILPTYEDPILAKIPGESEFAPTAVYRRAGDRYILLEYGDDVMSFSLSHRVHRLIEMVAKYSTIGIIEMSQGVRSVLIEFDGYKISQDELVKTLLAYESEIYFDNNWTVPSKIFKLPMAFEDSKTLACVQRYQETIRSSAPWLPNNVDFIADVNGITRQDIQEMMYSANFLVLGLGDVFLGSPCAIPLDPRQRYLGSKYNPSRTYTERGVVGLGGMYMCIYAASSPGGYQLVGRTIPIWDKLSLGNFSKEHPWMLSPFDQVTFYPVTEPELEKLIDDTDNGKFVVEIEETVFDHGKYVKWLKENNESITEFQANQAGGKKEEFNKIIQASNAEFTENKGGKISHEDKYNENATIVYSEYCGRFWKPIVSVGDVVEEGQGLIIIEAMKTEMVVASSIAGKVLEICHENGGIIDSGDAVVVIEAAAD